MNISHWDITLETYPLPRPHHLTVLEVTLRERGADEWLAALEALDHYKRVYPDQPVPRITRRQRVAD